MFHRRSAGAFRDYNTAHGLQPTPRSPTTCGRRSAPGSPRTMFVETYGREPADARELSGHLARISRQATTAVAGYDLTFSPVKSVSTLWAIAPREVARIIEQAHHDAVADTLTWLEDHAAYTRIGTGGVAQVDVHGLIAAAFTHRDSRAGDPDLHTHVAISNKVQTLDGRWYALDGRPIFKNNVAASERYNTRLEALLIERLGVAFADRAGDDPAKRPVREIVGVDGDLPRSWSSRRAAIDVRRAVLSAQVPDRPRPPADREGGDRAGPAGEPGDPAAQTRAPLLRRAARGLAGRGGRGAGRRGRGCTTTSATRCAAAVATRRGSAPASATCVGEPAAGSTVLSTVCPTATRATWQANHVRAEAERHVRAPGALRRSGPGRRRDRRRSADPDPVDPARGPLTPITAAVAEPALLRRRDGSSVFTVAGCRLLHLGRDPGRRGGDRRRRRAPRRAHRRAPVRGRGAARIGRERRRLNPGQVQLVRELATSGARVQLALAPAGTGKTTAMRVLARAWTACSRRHGGGTCSVWPRRPRPPRCCARKSAPTPTPSPNSSIAHQPATRDGAPAWLERDRAGHAGRSSTRPAWPAPPTWPPRSSTSPAEAGRCG